MKALVEDAWYPVLLSSRLRRHPITIERLGQRIVVWRAAGSVSAAPAACPHRGADLGAGRVRGGCLQCPYHGIEYDSGGTAVLRPAAGPEAPIPEAAHLRTLPARDRNGFIWIWHGRDEPASEPAWFDLPAPSVTVGADQIWDVHYSRFMEAALDFHHVPFVHRRYVPGVGPVVSDAEVSHDGDRIRMTGTLTTADRRRELPFEGEVLMPCTLRVVAAGTDFVAAGTPVDDERTWVAALYRPTYTGRVPVVRRMEAALAMFIDFKLFQRQDRAIFEGLRPGPSDLSLITAMPADRGTVTWIREWNRRVGHESSSLGHH